MNNLGIAFAALKKYDEVNILYFDKVLAINPNHEVVLINKGGALAKLKKYDDAILYFDKVLKINPENADVLYNKGATLANVPGSPRRLHDYDQILRIIPHNADALNNLGIGLLPKKYEDAIVYFDKALSINPTYKHALHNKGHAFAKMRKYPEAIACYDQILTISREHRCVEQQRSCS